MIQNIRGSHSNLLRIFGWVLHEPDVLHVVIESAERGLIAALREGLPEIIRMNVAVDVAEGLKAIHDANYNYNDLKPGNVLVSCVTKVIMVRLLRDLSSVLDICQNGFRMNETEFYQQRRNNATL